MTRSIAPNTLAVATRMGAWWWCVNPWEVAAAD